MSAKPPWDLQARGSLSIAAAGRRFAKVADRKVEGFGPLGRSPSFGPVHIQFKSPHISHHRGGRAKCAKAYSP